MCFFCPTALPLMVMASTVMVPQLCPEEKNSYFGFTLIGLVWAHAHFCQWLAVTLGLTHMNLIIKYIRNEIKDFLILCFLFSLCFFTFFFTVVFKYL